VHADPHQLQQVLMNLVLNAIQASSAGGEIRIRARATGNMAGQPCACIEIEDSGKGMSTDEVAKAFQPFFSTKAQGTGLGLAIAKQIVEQHGGCITLRSTLGAGTCVQVDLPAYSPPA
jgi:two-component system sensor histidine kinase AtoS